jgi:hypothetical protein
MFIQGRVHYNTFTESGQTGWLGVKEPLTPVVILRRGLKAPLLLRPAGAGSTEFLGLWQDSEY